MNIVLDLIESMLNRFFLVIGLARLQCMIDFLIV